MKYMFAGACVNNGDLTMPIIVLGSEFHSLMVLQ